jgi:hypothetical protein
MSKPEKVFKMGAVRASIFRNDFERDGKTVPLRKVVLEVRYKDKNGEWKGSNSFSTNEIPKAIVALQQAYEHLVGQGSETAGDDHSQPSASPWPRGTLG